MMADDQDADGIVVNDTKQHSIWKPMGESAVNIVVYNWKLEWI
jgi:hypothetical protein